MKKTYHALILSILLLGCSAAHDEPTSTSHKLNAVAAASPQSDIEKDVISKIPTAKDDKPVTVGSASFVVTESYFAASGKECKAVEISTPKNKSTVSRTVCNYDGTWGYSPDVLPTASNQ